MDFLIKGAQLILSLSILIFFHELGHYLFARLFKVRVDKFYMFFNPSFSVFRMKKINGKWRFKWFSKNDTNTKKRFNYQGEEVSEVIPTEELPDDNWLKYPESTEWGIGWLPMGGYCKIAGMIDESMDTEHLKKPAQSWEFRSKKAWQRLLIMIGGVSVNFIMAFLIYGAVLFSWGDSYYRIQETPMIFSETAKEYGYEDYDKIIKADTATLYKYSENTLLDILEAKQVTVARNGKEVVLSMPTKGLMREIMKTKEGFAAPVLPAIVDTIISGSPAEKFLQKNDHIINVNDIDILDFRKLVDYLNSEKRDSVNITLVRSNDTIFLKVPLNEEGKLGFGPKYSISTAQTDHYSFLQSIPAGFRYGFDKLRFYVRQMKYLFTKEGISSIGGFGAIGGMFSPSWNWHSFWENTAFISIALAFLNILPIPALDGGHVLFLLYEVITRRKPSEKFMTYAQLIGMLLLFSLFIFANGMDIIRGFFN